MQLFLLTEARRVSRGQLSGAATRGALLALWLLPEQTCGFNGLSYLKSQLEADARPPPPVLPSCLSL